MLNLTEKTFMQPTLALYLGGTGILVGEQLLTMLEELAPSERRLIEPFFIDSQEPAIADHERARHYCYKDLGVFSEPIYRDFTERRFPENLGASPVVSSCQGCGVTRIFGAASLVACRDGFLELVEQAAGRLRQRRAESTQPLQVFLTASACGGTGAGMILDAAALVRYVFRHRVGESPRIFFFLLGPSAFFEDPSIKLREDQRDRMQASTYALLKELHHFAQGNPFVSAYRLRDETVIVGNAADDDRLFDWVYFVDGRSEHGGAAKSLAEVAWTVAEAQVHLSATEVGRKVAESLPNLREERVRRYALNFVHPDNKDRLSEVDRRRLEDSSRITFLASLAVRNLRFPAEEIKTWFRWGWVCEALKMILRREQPNGGEAAVDQFDRVLGYAAGKIEPGGLLADLGLAEGQLLERVERANEAKRGLPSALGASITPDRLLGVEDFFQRMEDLLAGMRDETAESGLGPSPHDGVPTPRELASVALGRWSAGWTMGLAAGEAIAGRLWQLAWQPGADRGCGLRWLDDLLVHTVGVLNALEMARRERPSVDDLAARINEARQSYQMFEKNRRKEEKAPLFRLRRLWARLLSKDERPYSDAMRRKTRTVVTLLNALLADLLAERNRHLAAVIAPGMWHEAGRLLKRWRDQALLPTIIAADNGLTLASNGRELAKEALRWHQGDNRRGRWRALSTVQIAADDLLQALGKRLENRVWVEDLVLAPIQGPGLSRERRRLTIESFREMERQDLVEILSSHLTAATRGTLAFLDDGWMLPEAAEGLRTVGARVLDLGTEPLASFSQAALGLQAQAYLLAPRNLILPEPYGRTVGQIPRLTSRDPLQVGVVSFAYGIPPNSLEGIRELFLQYTVHLGDQKWQQAHDRYPLHVFRGAAEDFDEPHSPLTLQMSDEFLRSLLGAARELGILNGRRRVRLDIRSFDGTLTELLRDRNRVIELYEKVMHRLETRPQEAERLFGDGQFPDLERLFHSSRNGTAASWSAEGEQEGNIN